MVSVETKAANAFRCSLALKGDVVSLQEIRTRRSNRPLEWQGLRVEGKNGEGAGKNEGKEEGLE